MSAVAVKRIAILGATGSIGRSTLDVVRHWPEHFRVEALAAGNNLDVLVDQVREFRPRVVSFADPSEADRFASRVSAFGGELPEILTGDAGLIRIAGLDGVDLMVNGLVGSLGLRPTLEALGAGTSVAIANKEPLVVAGDLIRAAALARGAELLPLDSELSAIHQCLRGNPEKAIKRVILTASGGPFREMPASEFPGITPERALAHPTWDMGPKITVDSATLMNKGLEILETHQYFGVPHDRIDVVVHPQSLIHSMVEFVDHSVMAQISEPDMCLPIQYAMTWPERLPSPVARLDLVSAGSLTFEEPDTGRFPCLRLAREAGEAGGTAPAVLNAANEVAVEAFLAGNLSFDAIPAVIEECLGRCAGHPESSLENFEHADGLTRVEARRLVEVHNPGTTAPGRLT